jgi:hypothetical protein
MRGFYQAKRRLGRSQGCPALPVAQTKAIIQAIKGKQRDVSARPAAARISRSG